MAVPEIKGLDDARLRRFVMLVMLAWLLGSLEVALAQAGAKKDEGEGEGEGEGEERSGAPARVSGT